MQLASVKLDTLGATSGTFTHQLITADSKIQVSLQRDVDEDVLPLFATLVGPPRTGEQDWEINQGHDNPVSLYFTIQNGDLCL